MTTVEAFRRAAELGCPYLSISSPSEIKFSYHPPDESGSFSWCNESTHPYRRFIIGTVVERWAANEKIKTSISDRSKILELMQIERIAAVFAWDK